MTENRINDDFEQSFLENDLDRDIELCSRYELEPLFLELFHANQPVLEAGCGSGKWMHYFKRRGIVSAGIDWSPRLREQSLAFDPTVQFDNGDLRRLPYKDSSFGGLIALGSPEHVIEGPKVIFHEFHRVLRPGGVALITVPYMSVVRRTVYGVSKEPVRRLKRNRWLRKLCGKPSVKAGNPAGYSEMMKRKYRPDIYMHLDFDGYFYQYEFTKEQFKEELEDAAFRLDKLFAFSQYGLISTFGRWVGKVDRVTREPNFTVPGRLLRWIFPPSVSGHMLCAVVTK